MQLQNIIVRRLLAGGRVRTGRTSPVADVYSLSVTAKTDGVGVEAQLELNQ